MRINRFLWTARRVVLIGVSGLSASMLQAQSSFFQAEGVTAIAAGSINPPNPVAACEGAKKNASDKAIGAGFPKLVEWSRLSNDSDCSLQTQGARGAGYLYIFTAKGKFTK